MQRNNTMTRRFTKANISRYHCRKNFVFEMVLDFSVFLCLCG